MRYPGPKRSKGLDAQDGPKIWRRPFGRMDRVYPALQAPASASNIPDGGMILRGTSGVTGDNRLPSVLGFGYNPLGS